MHVKAGNSSETAFVLRAAFVLLYFSMPAGANADATADVNPDSAALSGTNVLIPATPAFTGAVIGDVNILNDSIFDLDIPEEDKALYRLANRLHVTTRPGVIQQQLLFNEGDKWSVSRIQESERILRGNRYIQNANIDTVRNGDGTVDVNVHTSDVWTLIPRISLSRSGGENKSGIGIKELNLLGTGIQLEALYKSNIDRDSAIFRFTDRHLGNSWYSLNAVIAENSDGHTRLLDLERPFYSLDSSAAHGVSYLDDDRIDALYDGGEITNRFRHQSESFSLYRGWSKGLRNGWTRRYIAGIAYDDHRFSIADDDPAPVPLLPDDRTLVYPYVGIEILEDRFEKTSNVDQVNRTEDRFLGTRFTAQLGYAGRRFGSDRNAWIVNAGLQRGFGSSDDHSLIFSSDLSTRIEDSGAENLTLDVGAKYFRRQSDKRLFYASLSGTYGYNLDVDNQLLLGGDNGLRGYPLRYQGGDRMALLTLEQRYFTDWYPFRLFRVGGAVFFDAGKAWHSQGDDRPGSELLKNVGFGLRLGNTRSGQGRMTHIDLAFPLDGDQGIKNVQFLIETRKSF